MELASDLGKIVCCAHNAPVGKRRALSDRATDNEQSRGKIRYLLHTHSLQTHLIHSRLLHWWLLPFDDPVATGARFA